MIIEPIHGSGARSRTLCLYLEEKAQEDSAAAAIAAVWKAIFLSDAPDGAVAASSARRMIGPPAMGKRRRVYDA